MLFAAPVSRLPPGLVVPEPPPDGESGEVSIRRSGDASLTGTWNRVLLVAKPRIAAGDVNLVSPAIRDAASQFRLTLMAKVGQEDEDQRFHLHGVGIGYSYPINGQLTVIDGDSASRLGASLGFIEGQVLSENESHLTETRVVVHTSTLMIFDVPAIYHRFGKHLELLSRHLVWIDRSTGKTMMANWLMSGDDQRNDYRNMKEPIRLVPGGTHEDRVIHVDQDHFFLGIPSRRGFALVNLPPGIDLSWNAALSDFAVRRQYDGTTLARLVTHLNRKIAEQTKDSPPSNQGDADQN
ncbi:hypothetical protein V7x_06070 [Crateriforma conspicua]|uniref:Uncharacterized protein n=1 Tax=Crateriforma conspicua TaxID=2527996 RepID=A0A5C6FVF3_9PLAN|nr:hypothetical protein [Crateriforma conspicua]TWU65063.1 hypothetical protein V7x_06070 [Crateriforma conspicua]